MLSKRNEMDQRDGFAIEELCQKTWKEVYRFIYYKVQNREEAEDITQETYARAIDYLIRKNTNVLEIKGYLKMIAMNIIRDQWRSRQRKGFHMNLDDVSQEDIAIQDFSNQVDDRTMITKAMKCLSKEQQMIIDLRVIKGYSSSETAKIMKKKEGTIRVIQYRALKALAETLESWSMPGYRD